MKKIIKILAVTLGLVLTSCGSTNNSMSTSFSSVSSSSNISSISSSLNNSSSSSSTPVVRVTSVSLDKTNINVFVGESTALVATVFPNNATDKSLTWRSLDDKVATVNNGTVKGISAGSTQIIVLTNDGNFLASCNVNVTIPNYPVLGITLNYHAIQVNEGATYQLNATFNPENATNKGLIWTSDNEQVAKVNSTGLVSGIYGGVTIIRVTSVDGNFTDACTVQVLHEVIHVTGISLNKNSLTLEAGSVGTLLANVTPNNADDKSVVWTSANENVALVNNGIVSAVAVGETTIKAETVDGKFSATCSVTVNPKKQIVNVRVSDIKKFIDDFKTSPTVNGEYTDVVLTNVGDILTCTLETGHYVKIHVGEVNGFIISNIKVDDFEYTPNSNGNVTFVVGETDFDIIVNYVEDVPLEGPVALIAVNSEHLSLTFYSENKRNIVSSTNDYQKIYVKVDSSSTDYAVRSIYMEYRKDDVGSSTKEDLTYEESSDMYYFKVPHTYNNKVSIIVEEKDLNQFKNYDFVGSYFFLRTFSMSNGDNGFNKFYEYNGFTYTMTVQASGDIVFAGGSPKNDSIVSYDEAAGEIDNMSHSSFKYENGIMTLGVGSDSNLTTPFQSTNDTVVAIKKANENDVAEDYSFHNEIFTMSGKKYIAADIYYKNNPYKTYFVEYANNKGTIYTNIDFVMHYGNYINDDKCFYEVSKNGNTIISVSYQYEGGYKNRIPLSGICGIYHLDGNDLLIPNEKEIFLNGEEQILKEINGNNVSFYNGSCMYEVELNQGNGTYNVISSNALNLLPLDLRGLLFTGHKSSDNGYLGIQFANYTDTISGKLLIDQYPRFEVSFTATYDAQTFMLTFLITARNYEHSGIPIGGTFRGLVKDGSITFKTGFNNQYDFLKITNDTITNSEFKIFA